MVSLTPPSDAMTAAGPHLDISILLVSWNTCALTGRCLDTLPQSVDPRTRYETVVVDNGSTDGSLAMLRARDDVLLVENAENLGYAKAVNQAYARARGRMILLLNSDIEFKPGSLGALLRFLEQHPEVTGVGPMYLNPDGSPQQHHYRLPTFGMLVAGQSALLERLPWLSQSTRRHRMEDADFGHAQPVEQPSASVLLLRREALPDDHLLDERFPIFFNDVELAHRLGQAGRVLWMTPDSLVIHAHGASTRQLGRGLVRHHLSAQVLYVALTQSKARLLAFRAIVLAHELAALLLRRPDALSPADLLPALRGEPGPLGRAPDG